MDDVLYNAARHRVQIMLGVCTAGVIIGSLAPWARIVVNTVSGVSGDGQITLFLGVFAGVFVVLEVMRDKVSRTRYLSVMFAFFLAGLIGLNAWLSVSTTIAEGELNASVEWGLQLMTVAAFIGGVIAYLQVKAINREKRRQNRLLREQQALEADDPS